MSDKTKDTKEQPKQDTVTMSREDLDSFVADMLGDPSEEEVREAEQEVQPKQERSTPDINGTGSGHPDADTDAVVRGDAFPQWKKRAHRVLQSYAVQNDDRRKAQRLLRSVVTDLRSMPDAQWFAEQEESKRVIERTNLSRQQKQRMYFTLDMDPQNTRLHTTSTSDDPKTGFLLPKPFLAELLVIIEEFGEVRNLFRAIPMTSKDIDLKEITSKVEAFWTGEGVNFTSSFLEMGEEKLMTNKLAGITAYTTELTEDSAIAFLPSVQQLFAESIMEKEDLAGLLGDGSSSFGGFTGLLNADNVQEVVATQNSGTAVLAPDTGEAYLRQMKGQLSRVRRRGAVWIGHYSVLEAIRQFETSGGFRIHQENLTGEGADSVLGYPFVESEVMPDITDVGGDTPFLVLGRTSDYAFMGNRRGMTADTSREAILQAANGDISFNAFQADGQLVKISERIGFKIPPVFGDAFSVLKTAAS